MNARVGSLNHWLNLESLLTLQVFAPLVTGGAPLWRPPGPAQDKLTPAPLMVHFSNFHSPLPFESGKSDSSKLETRPFLPAVGKTMRRPHLRRLQRQAPPAA